MFPYELTTRKTNDHFNEVLNRYQIEMSLSPEKNYSTLKYV